MKSSDDVVDAVKDLFAATNPGLITKDDMANLHERMDELESLVDQLEMRLNERGVLER